jgi:protein TonB
MRAVLFSAIRMSSDSTQLQPLTSDYWRRGSVVALVLAAHLLGLLVFTGQGARASVPSPEMSVALLSAPEIQPGEQAPAPALESQQLTGNKPEFRREPPATSAALTAAESVANPPAAEAPVAAAPVAQTAESVVADVEPDYQASYLRNPSPVYPLAARRMALQGRVVLNVEVLAEGRCGQISVRQSSGFEVLDRAALQTVKEWRFVPATHAGLAVTRWFQVPVNFRLRNEES